METFFWVDNDENMTGISGEFRIVVLSMSSLFDLDIDLFIFVHPKVRQVRECLDLGSADQEVTCLFYSQYCCSHKFKFLSEIYKCDFCFGIYVFFLSSLGFPRLKRISGKKRPAVGTKLDFFGAVWQLGPFWILLAMKPSSSRTETKGFVRFPGILLEHPYSKFRLWFLIVFFFLIDEFYVYVSV